MEGTTEIVKAVLDFLEKTGGALLSAGFTMAVKYSFVEGLMRTIGGLGSFIIFAICVANIFRLTKRADNDTDYGNSGYFGAVIIVNIVLALFFLVAGFASQLLDGIAMMLAPEWYAILNIIDLVK